MEAATGCFSARYVDPSGFERILTLSYFQSDRSVSLYDTKAGKSFLKRIQPPENIDINNLYLGASVTICSRPMKIIGFADDKTKRLYTTTRGSSLLLIKPDAYRQMGQILDVIFHSDLAVGRIRMVRFTLEEANQFAALSGSETSAVTLTKDNMLAIELAGEDVVSRVHELAGPADPSDARSATPNSIRALFGESRERNAVHASSSMETAKLELAFIFDRSYPYTARYNNNSAVIIKPHVVESKLAGRIFDAILETGLEISAVRSMIMGFNDAAEYLEHYKGVVPEYSLWVKEVTSGPSIVLEIRGESCVHRIRELFGPYDPVIAQALRPDTIRSRFGIDVRRNAVFCTDIERDGPLEAKFLFTVL
jgi:nucleoside-diphosphate kinase